MTGRFSKLEVQQSKVQAATIAPAELLGVPVRTPQDDLRAASDAWRMECFESALQHYTRALRDDRGLIPAWVGQVQMLVELHEHPEARLWADKALELFRNNGELLAARALAAHRAGDHQAALIASDDCLKAPGTSPLRWRVRAEIMLRSAADRARDCFEKSLVEPGTDWFDRVLIARVYATNSLPAAALVYAQQGLDMQPGHPITWVTIGRCQAALGMSEKAALSFQRATQLPGGREPGLAALKSLAGTGSPTRLSRWLTGLFKR